MPPQTLRSSPPLNTSPGNPSSPKTTNTSTGQVYAMGGGSVNHSRIAVRLAALLDTHLINTGCITSIQLSFPIEQIYRGLAPAPAQ
ncbi:MAG: hypothetical protein WBA10_03300 [Elainellaceae cyanobacterium]